MDLWETLNTLTTVFPKVTFFQTFAVGGTNLINQRKQTNRIYPPCSCDPEFRSPFPPSQSKREAPTEWSRSVRKERSRNWGFPRVHPQVEGRPKMPSTKRSLLAVRVRPRSGRVVVVTDLGLLISVLFIVPFWALRWDLGIVRQGLVILFHRHGDWASRKKSNFSRLIPPAWGQRLYFITFISSVSKWQRLL